MDIYKINKKILKEKRNQGGNRERRIFRKENIKINFFCEPEVQKKFFFENRQINKREEWLNY